MRQAWVLLMRLRALARSICCNCWLKWRKLSPSRPISSRPLVLTGTSSRPAATLSSSCPSRSSRLISRRPISTTSTKMLSSRVSASTTRITSLPVATCWLLSSPSALRERLASLTIRLTFW